MSQLVYNDAPEIGIEGGIADNRFSLKTTGMNASGAALPAGIGVKRGVAGDDSITPITSVLDKCVGVVIHNHGFVNENLANVNGKPAIVPNYTMCNLMREGAILVKVEENVSAGDDVFMRHESDGGSNLQTGTFRKSVDSGRAHRMPGMKFATSASSGGLAKLEILRAPDEVGVSNFVQEFEHAAATTDQTNVLFKAMPDRFMVLTKVRYYNATGLAQDAANYFNIKLQLATGPVVLANWSTLTGANGSIAAATWVDLTLAATPVITPDSTVQLFNDETGDTTLPAGKLVIEGYYL